MIGDAVPVRYSRRIRRNASLSPIKVFLKKKTRRPAVKKRTSVVNSALLIAKEKSKVSKKSKSVKNSKQTLVVHSPLPRVTEKIKVRRKSKPERDSKQISVVDSSLCKVKEKTKVGRKSKLEKNPKQASKFSRKSSRKSKLVTRGRLKEDLPEIFGQKSKTTDSLNASQVNLTVNKSLKNLILDGERKKVIVRKSCTELTGNKKAPDRRSLRVSKSSLSLEKKGVAKEPNKSDLKSSREKSPSLKKYSSQVTSLCSKSVFLTPNTKKSTRTSRYSERKKSARLSTEPLNKEISLYTPSPKSLPIASNTEKNARTSRNLKNRKSRTSSMRPNHLRVLHSDISLHTSAFQSILETPHPEKHSEKRKSSRLLQPSPLRTLNKELSLSTPEFIFRKNPDSRMNKSSKSNKSDGLHEAESLSKKRGRRKLLNKETSTNSCDKLKRNSRRRVDQHKKASEENFKTPFSNKTEQLPIDILSTPAYAPMQARSISKKYFSKSDSKSSKRKFHVSSTENHIVSEEMQDVKKRKKSADFPNIPGKGTLKHKRWLLNNLKEKNTGYEDDIFENQNFSLYKTAFHFGDESDGSSVNIATPKFDCILTPALPKKTPRFKDCISPSELMQARKTAEEYLYRRNKKRKSGDRPSCSSKNSSMNKKNTTEAVPEKKKLDFEEAVNKLIAVQKDLEKDAEIDDEEEDSYFSDASN